MSLGGPSRVRMGGRLAPAEGAAATAAAAAAGGAGGAPRRDGVIGSRLSTVLPSGDSTICGHRRSQACVSRPDGKAGAAVCRTCSRPPQGTAAALPTLWLCVCCEPAASTASRSSSSEDSRSSMVRILRCSVGWAVWRSTCVTMLATAGDANGARCGALLHDAF